MARLHLVELEDLPWFPAILREGGTAFLAFAERVSGHGRALAPPLLEALRQTGHTHLVDLCSGSGGPAAVMADELRRQGYEIRVTLTDLYPHTEAYTRVEARTEGRVKGFRVPVDATAIPAELRGFRTIFNAFHHFPPDQARAVLQAAVNQGQPIGVFEVVSRDLPMLMGLLMAPLTVTLSMPFWRPFRWHWLLLTWVLPVMQPFVLWDGVVSWLRIYSEGELRALVDGLDAPGWTWTFGRLRLGQAPMHGTYLIGVPPTG